MSAETWLLRGALAAYALATFVALGRKAEPGRAGRILLAWLGAGLLLHAASLGLRWTRLGHGPFLTMYEILSSNIWSLTAIWSFAAWRVRELRPSAAVTLPILCVMMLWLLVEDPRAGHLPPTYDTPLLYVHVALGKLFLGSVLAAVGLSGVILLRASAAGRARFAALRPDAQLEDLAYRFLLLALVFETSMLVAGAAWAQDAWGRYWAWDPLETWAFMTWLLLVFAIHLRVAGGAAPRRGAALALGVFVLAFLTFFGVPFISKAPHQGAV